MGKVFFVMIGAVAFIMLACILGSLVGAFSGLIVNLFFGAAIQEVMLAVGIAPVALWKVGATLGFVGGFFRTTVNAGK